MLFPIGLIKQNRIMKLNTIKVIVGLVLFIGFFINIKPVFAAQPSVSAYVTTATGVPIPNVWVKWQDNYQNIRYEKTNGD